MTVPFCKPVVSGNKNTYLSVRENSPAIRSNSFVSNIQWISQSQKLSAITYAGAGIFAIDRAADGRQRLLSEKRLNSEFFCKFRYCTEQL